MDAVHTLNGDLDAALARLSARAATWATLPLERKIDLLLACRDRTARCAVQWSAIAAEIKGVSSLEAAGEEALSGPWGTMRALDAYIRTLRRVQSGRPRVTRRRVRARPGGGARVGVFPNTLLDRCFLFGVHAEVWLQPGSQLRTAGDTADDAGGRVVAVMGAGNVTSIGVLDVLSKLVNDNAVCILKVHPLLKPLVPVFTEIFAPLIDEGFVAATCGDAGEGAFLCNHPLVDAVHVTGSAATYGAIAAETTKPPSWATSRLPS